MSADPGVVVSGGGSVSVDTEPMLAAAHVIAYLHDGLGAIAASIAAGIASGSSTLWPAEGAARAAVARSGEVAAALRTAALHYGEAEQRAEAAQVADWGTQGALFGLLARVDGAPVGTLLLAVGMVLGDLAIRAMQPADDDGAVWMNPAVLRDGSLALASIDDLARGFLLQEPPGSTPRNDPSAPFGTEAVAGALGGLVYGRAPRGRPHVAPTVGGAVRPPEDIEELAARIPDGELADGQIRIERYDGADGPRWIVYSAGTVTFDRDSGAQPFDMRSNMAGVAHGYSESEDAVLEAMQQAGIGADDRVLLVGHSQGALNAVRVAQDGGYRVAGVVEFGGPTGQIALPASIPRISFEHAQDPVPHLGGVAAVGAAGANRVLVRRELTGVQRTSGIAGQVPAHSIEAYEQTAEMAEAAGAPQVERFEAAISDFTEGPPGDPGTAAVYRAERITPPPARTAGAAAAPPPSPGHR